MTEKTKIEKGIVLIVEFLSPNRDDPFLLTVISRYKAVQLI